MSLTHVQILSPKSAKWENISIEEAEKRFPHSGVSARSGIFRCSLCGQYITLAKGEIQSTHFRHKKEEDSSDCPDRTERNPLKATSSTLRPGTQILPLRIKLLSDKRFTLEIGLPPLPLDILDTYGAKKLTIHGAADRPNDVSYLLSRVSDEQMVYLLLGAYPADRYQLSVEETAESVMQYWPNEAEGISRDGSLFDAESRKKLPFDADAQIQHPYYLVTKQHDLKGSDSLEIELQCRYSTGRFSWFVYRILAKSIDVTTVEFFMEYHCRLTEKPISVLPLWPVYTKSPYVIYHDSRQMMLYLRGEADPKLYPVDEQIKTIPCNGGGLIVLYGRARQQLLSIGRVRVLQSMYLWQRELDYLIDAPVVSVTDVNGAEIPCGDSNKLPQRGQMIITAPYDGTVRVTKNQTLQSILSISADTPIKVDSVSFGQTVEIYQGLDCIWRVSFVRKKEPAGMSDAELYRKLMRARGERTGIPHAIGALAKKMKDYPMTRQWLRQQIATGTISVEALQHLERFFLKGKLRYGKTC